ncbi:MAG TPA: hypothetical protein VGF69_08995 [Thermoanaerobaculia bacterium]|jgi:hypothetical protein
MPHTLEITFVGIICHAKLDAHTRRAVMPFANNHHPYLVLRQADLKVDLDELPFPVTVTPSEVWIYLGNQHVRLEPVITKAPDLTAVDKHIANLSKVTKGGGTDVADNIKNGTLGTAAQPIAYFDYNAGTLNPTRLFDSPVEFRDATGAVDQRLCLTREVQYIRTLQDNEVATLVNANVTTQQIELKKGAKLLIQNARIPAMRGKHFGHHLVVVKNATKIDELVAVTTQTCSGGSLLSTLDIECTNTQFP